MSNQKHHGMGKKHAIDHQCHYDSYEQERIGRFGRLFRSEHGVSPLYTNPVDLIELGKKGGVMDSMGNKQVTNTVPLGMVFLGQFIDHDITLDTQSRFNLVNEAEEIENFRTPALDLDCIFGEGPEDEPFLYEKDSLRLLTGETNKNIAQPANLEKEDLARNGQGKAIIGDARNDENRVVSQLQLLFIRFYNKVYDKVQADHPGYSETEVYEEARMITTWHYQWVVLYEFLPAMIGQGLLTKILSGGRNWYTPYDRPYIPIEFSVAAYRFGHSMVPQQLRLKSGGGEHDLFSPTFGGGFAKITSTDQVVDWNQFFDVDGSHQFTTRLDTKMSSELLDLPFMPPGTPAPERSLATRNLLRGNSFLLPSGEVVADCLAVSPSDLDRVVDTVNDMLNGKNINLSNGIPLWFYILAEGGELGKDGTPGEGLGEVGGTIVGEVLTGLLELDPNSFLSRNRNWIPSLGTGSSFSMKDLITFTST